MLSRDMAGYDPYSLVNPPLPAYPFASKIAYFGLNIFGAIICGLLLLTICLSHDIKRDKTVYNFFAIILLVPVVECLMMNNSDAFPGGNVPSFGACLFQASLVIGLSTAQAAAGMALVFKVWLTAANLTSKRFASLDRPAVDWSLVVLPWTCWLAYIIANVVIGVRKPQTVISNGWYCFTRHQKIFDAHHYTNAAFAIPLVLFEFALAWRVFVLYRKRIKLRRQVADAAAADAHQLDSSMNATWAGFGMPFAFRTLVFGTYTLVLVAVSIWLLFDAKSAASSMPDILNASVAPAAGLVFSTQGDVIAAWRSLPDRMRSWWTSRQVARRTSAASGQSGPATMDSKSTDDDGHILQTPPKTPTDDRAEFLMSFEDMLGMESTNVLDYDAPRPSLFSMGRRSTAHDVRQLSPSSPKLS